MLRVVVELLAEGLDVRVDGARVAGEVVTPDAGEQLLATEHLSRMGHEEREQIEFLRLERDLASLEGHAVADGIEQQPRALETLADRAGRPPRPPQQRAYPRHELAGRERLR